MFSDKKLYIIFLNHNLYFVIGFNDPTKVNILP